MKIKFFVIGIFLILFNLNFILAQPPQEAVNACAEKSVDDSCNFIGRQGETLKGICNYLEGTLACKPSEEKQVTPELFDKNNEKTFTEQEEKSIGFFKRIFNFLFGWLKSDNINEQKENIQEQEKNSLETKKIVPTNSKTNFVDTGQVKCYNERDEISCPNEGENFYGQDGNYEKSQLSYNDNGDGTITDLNTGLIWQQNPGNKQNYYDAIDGAEDFDLAGYNDWRVPTTKELYSLIDFSGVDVDPMATNANTPFIDDEVFGFEYGDTSAGDRVIDSQWVTSNVYVSKVMNGEECFFGLNFADGRIKCYPTISLKNNGYFAIYVRGNYYGINEFVDNGDGTISDNSNGLMWQKTDSGEGMNWEDALSYCEDLSFANYDDWRLPNVKELQYIIDYSKSPDTTNSAALDTIFQISEITNEAGEKDYPWYWSGTTHVGQMGGQSASYVAFGRALGYMGNKWIDVHGAGAQRSDPKIGDPDDYPEGHGPQGDAIRIYNYVRCVRD